MERDLALHERILLQFAVPVPPHLQAILIQGACFIRPSHAPEQRGQCTIEPRELCRVEQIVLEVGIGFHDPAPQVSIGFYRLVGLARPGVVIPYLETLSKDTDPEVAQEGLRALRNLNARL